MQELPGHGADFVEESECLLGATWIDCTGAAAVPYTLNP
jgi:hypothetical protein